MLNFFTDIFRLNELINRSCFGRLKISVTAKMELHLTKHNPLILKDFFVNYRNKKCKENIGLHFTTH